MVLQRASDACAVAALARIRLSTVIFDMQEAWSSAGSSNFRAQFVPMHATALFAAAGIPALLGHETAAVPFSFPSPSVNSPPSAARIVRTIRFCCIARMHVFL